MPQPYSIKLKPQVCRQSLAGLLHLMVLTAFTFGSISCAGKSGSSNSGGATPATSPIAQNSPVEPVAPRKIFNSGEAVPAGYLGYKVFRSWFSDHAVQKDGKQSGPGTYLSIDLAIVNTDKKERDVAPMKLVDEAGKEYALSEKSATLEGSVTRVGKVSPNQSKRAVALFEVPKGHEYKLKIQGFSPADEVQITLAPVAAPPSH
ncbi:MAG: hypothetical protein JWM21_2460 [Acidobacteria bacterium]|nr:hypothetical protein [Acidobacteriota bacterium]